MKGFPAKAKGDPRVVVGLGFAITLLFVGSFLGTTYEAYALCQMALLFIYGFWGVLVFDLVRKTLFESSRSIAHRVCLIALLAVPMLTIASLFALQRASEAHYDARQRADRVQAVRDLFETVTISRERKAE